MKNLKFWILICGFTFYLLPFTFLFAQPEDRLVTLSKQIIEAKSNEELYAPFEELKELYFKDNRYTDFTEFLKSLSQQKKTLEPFTPLETTEKQDKNKMSLTGFTNYYIALSRYHQLKYLEGTQKWDEYFSQGNTYRDELMQRVQNSIDATTTKDALHLYARLILWQFHKDQQDVFSAQALTDLTNSVLEYSKASSDIKPIKEIADKVLSFGEKGKSRELYKIYAQRLIASDIKDEALAAIALGFYKEGNLELAESIYDVYVDRITKSSPQGKSIPVLINIAKSFAYKNEGANPVRNTTQISPNTIVSNGANDMLYAEKIFKKIEELGGKQAFNQELMYLRAFNLEKAKEFIKAKDVYSDLVLMFPETNHTDEAIFKMGIINTYVLRNKKEGRNYFEKLIQKKQTLNSWGISGLYQLGLLSQWENDYPAAKDYYNKLIYGAGDSFQEELTVARERLKEIEQVKPIEYNLRTFLDASLKEEYSMFDMTKLDLKCNPYTAKKEEAVDISTTTYASPSGCMQIELQYLWSGDLGSKKPFVDQAAFKTTYTDMGTKVINLVVVSPTGIIDRSLDLVDVY